MMSTIMQIVIWLLLWQGAREPNTQSVSLPLQLDNACMIVEATHVHMLQTVATSTHQSSKFVGEKIVALFVRCHDQYGCRNTIWAKFSNSSYTCCCLECEIVAVHTINVCYIHVHVLLAFCSCCQKSNVETQGKLSISTQTDFRTVKVI